MSNIQNHWSNTSYDFKILGLPAGPVVCSFPLLILMQFSKFFLFIFLAIWAYYIIFVWIFKLSPRHSWYLVRTSIVGKKRNPRNENSPLQY